MNRRSFFGLLAAAAVVPQALWAMCKRTPRAGLANYPTRYTELSKHELRKFAPTDAVDWPEWLSWMYTDQKAPGFYVVEYPRGNPIWIKRRLVWDPAFCSRYMTSASLRAEADRRAQLLGFS